MPLFSSRKVLKDGNPEPTPPQTNGVRDVTMAEPQKPKLVFHCQQAQGSPTGLISGFSNVKELYQKIAECYDFPAEDIFRPHSGDPSPVSGGYPLSSSTHSTRLIQIYLGCKKRGSNDMLPLFKTADDIPVRKILFCTLNTHKMDMTKLLGGQIGLDDFIFVHRKGRPKEIELRKTEDALGLTITDNGCGYAFIKRIKEGSVIDGIEYIQVGDHIERINSENLVGKRHFEVAKMLKEIPRDTVFTIRLIEPLKAGFSNIDSRGNSRRGKKTGYGTGKETLRLKADGKAQVQQVSSAMQQGIDSINQLLEGFMGINDNELATQIWEHAEGKTNSMDFAEAIDNSDLEEFGFTDDFIIELWGVITDARSGRVKSEVF